MGEQRLLDSKEQRKAFVEVSTQTKRAGKKRQVPQCARPRWRSVCLGRSERAKTETRSVLSIKILKPKIAVYYRVCVERITGGLVHEVYKYTEFSKNHTPAGPEEGRFALPKTTASSPPRVQNLERRPKT